MQFARFFVFITAFWLRAAFKQTINIVVDTMPQVIRTSIDWDINVAIKSIATVRAIANTDHFRILENFIPIIEKNIETTQDSKDNINPQKQKTISSSQNIIPKKIGMEIMVRK